MGGNARGTNKKTGKDTLAQKIPIKKIGRTVFNKNIINLLTKLNNLFNERFGKNLWDDIKILEKGMVFNGSTALIMNPKIHDNEILPFKPVIGDLDIMVPSENSLLLWELLDSLEGKHIIKGVVYKGCNRLKPSSITDQINSVFEIDFGKITVQCQLDFEMVEFKDKIPTEFSIFSHSSSLIDAQNGFKGIANKYLLRSLAGGLSKKLNALVITNQSTYNNYRIKKINNKPVVPNFLKFSVTKGLRYAYEKQKTPLGKDWVINEKKVYKEILTKDSSYLVTVSEIFKVLFSTANDCDKCKMWSFVGVINLIKANTTQKQQQETFNRMLEICWGENAQKLERDSKDLDFEIKSKIVNYMVKHLSVIDTSSKMIYKYYKKYGEN